MSFAAVAIGGLALGAGSSYLSARSANKQASRSRQASQQESQRAMSRLGTSLFGADGWDDYELAATGDPNNRWTQDARSRVGAAYPSLFSVMTDAGNQQLAEIQQAAAGRRAGTARLQRLAGGMEGIGGDIEARQLARIQREGKKQLANMNARSSASLGMLGPSTLLANQQAGNARSVGESMSDASLAASVAGADRRMAGRGALLNTMGMRQSLEDSMGQADINSRYQARTMPAQTRQQILSSGVFSPYLGNNMTQFYGSASPGGAAAGALGQGMGFLGMMGSMGGFGGGGGGGGGVAGGNNNWAGGNVPTYMPWAGLA